MFGFCWLWLQRTDCVSADLSMWRKVCSRPKSNCTIFPLSNTWSVDPALSAVPNKPGNPRSLFSLSFPLQDRPLAFLFFSQYFHFSVYHHLSLIPPSLHTDLLFNWPVYASLHVLQSQKGDKGESIGLCYCWDCCCLGIVSSTAAPPFHWHCGSHCTGVSKLTKQVTTLASQIEVIINSVMRLLALVSLAYFTQHTLVACFSFITSINQLGSYGSINWVNIYRQYFFIFIDMIHCNIRFYEATHNLPGFENSLYL